MKVTALTFPQVSNAVWTQDRVWSYIILHNLNREIIVFAEQYCRCDQSQEFKLVLRSRHSKRLVEDLSWDVLAGVHFSEFDKTDSLFLNSPSKKTFHVLWKLFCFSTRGSSYELFTMAPSRIERIDNTRGAKQFESRLHPADIKLVDAMATSAAVVSYRMGEYTLQQLQNLQIMLGIGMGAAIKTESRCRGCFSRVCYSLYW